MEYYHAVSMKLIEKTLISKQYSKKSQIRDHLRFLQNIANDLNEKIIEQKQEGIICWESEADLKKVQKLFMRLNAEMAIHEEIDFNKDITRKDLF